MDDLDEIAEESIDLALGAVRKLAEIDRLARDVLDSPDWAFSDEEREAAQEAIALLAPHIPEQRPQRGADRTAVPDELLPEGEVWLGEPWEDRR